ncbi:hypothetical protein OIU83_15500 [Flavobacterium sp. LS1R49]|uniref:Uncharacterized protein n=1 Tax=Flavobacterium shii TaxID=2987687 RepID=A0A9X2ZGT3_9FLAO|nr:hypothetical protein [Flavobacterium shii]MCV9929070.1 hypothetical protein [Flavobacterium shii]
MKSITLKKIEVENFQILQSVVAQCRIKNLRVMQTIKYSDVYFNNMLTVDVSTNLFFRFRMKIENQHKPIFNLKLKIYEAIILLQCCNDYEARNEYEKFIVRKHYNEIYEQLINL